MYVSSCLCSLRSPSSCEHLPGETVSSRNPRPIFQSLASLRLSLGLKDLHYAFHGASGKEPTFQCRRCKRLGFDPWVEKIPWRRAGLPTPVFFPGECYRQRNPAGYSPWGHKESDTTEQLSPHVPHTADEQHCVTLRWTAKRWGSTYTGNSSFSGSLRQSWWGD